MSERARLDARLGMERTCDRDRKAPQAFQPEQEALFVLLASVARRVILEDTASRPTPALRVIK